MKKIITTLCIALISIGHAFAHHFWIETKSKGAVNQEQQIRVYFGEYSYSVMEKVKEDAYKNVKYFTLRVVNNAGKQTKLEVIPKRDHYLATFTPKEEGIYTVILNNDNIDVIDYSQYNFGIFKAHYHSVTKFQVGKKTGSTAIDNLQGITVKNVSETEDEVKLQVFYKNKVSPETEVKIFVADQWSKTLETDEDGFVAFNLPWEGKYIVEITKKEEVPGTYRKVDYEFVWHCVTHYLTK